MHNGKQHNAAMAVNGKAITSEEERSCAACVDSSAIHYAQMQTA